MGKKNEEKACKLNKGTIALTFVCSISSRFLPLEAALVVVVGTDVEPPPICFDVVVLVGRYLNCNSSNCSSETISVHLVDGTCDPDSLMSTFLIGSL